MQEEKSCCFFGTDDFRNVKQVKEKIQEAIEILVNEVKITSFYFVGGDKFNRLCKELVQTINSPKISCFAYQRRGRYLLKKEIGSSRPPEKILLSEEKGDFVLFRDRWLLERCNAVLFYEQGEFLPLEKNKKRIVQLALSYAYQLKGKGKNLRIFRIPTENKRT